jgi:hypothetical protein
MALFFEFFVVLLLLVFELLVMINQIRYIH